MDYVYQVENFTQAVEEIRERTNGRLILRSQEKNRNANSPSKDYRNLY